MKTKILSLAGILIMGMASAVCALDEKNLIFHAPFDETTDAAVAVGEKKASVVGKPQLVPGILGKAVEVAHLQDGVVFKTAGNFPQGADAPSSGIGTISFWIEPVEWDASIDMGIIPFISSRPEEGKSAVNIQTIWPWRSINFFLWSTYRANTMPTPGFPDCRGAGVNIKSEIKTEAMGHLRPGNWFHVAYTFREGRIVAYRNGRQGDRAIINHPSVSLGKLGEDLAVGYGGWEQPMFIDPNCEKNVAENFKKHWRFRIDDVAVFNVALHPDQVLALHDAGRKGLNAAAFCRASPVAPPSYAAYHYNHKSQLVGKLETFEPQERIGRVVMEIREVGGRMALETGEMTWDAARQLYIRRHDLSHLPQARLETLARVIGKDGKELSSSNVRTFNRRVPLWINNSHGMRDEVPAPWTPVKADEKSTSMYGRNYVWGPDLTLAAIQSQGQPVLARPMTLRLVQNGQEQAFTATEKGVSTVRASGTEDTRRAFGRLGDIPAEAKAVTGFDGFTRWDLWLAPNAPTRVEALWLEIPIRKEVARWFHSPNRREGTVPQKTMSGEFPSDPGFGSGQDTWMLTAHDGTRGFQWAMERDQYWSNADRGRQIQVIPRDNEFVMRFNIIDRPTVIRSQVQYTMAFEAIPARPIPRPWGSAPYTHIDQETKIAWDFPVPDYRLLGGDRATGLVRAGEGRDWQYWRQSPCGWSTAGWGPGDFGYRADADEKELDDLYWRADRAPKLTTDWNGYIFSGTIWLANAAGFSDAGEIFATDWSNQLEYTPVNSGAAWQHVLVNAGMKGYQDWLAYWTARRAMRAPGLYYDHSNIMQSSNPENGSAYIDEEGRVRPTMVLFGARDAQMRAYKAFKEIRPWGKVVQHTSGISWMGVDAFIDVKFNGENMSYGDRVALRTAKQGFWSECLPMDLAMSECFHRPYGYAPLGCWQWGDAKNYTPEQQARIARDFRAVLFQIGRPNEFGGYGVGAKVWGDHYPMEQIRGHVGWWEQKSVKGADPVYVALWPVGGGEMMMSLSNLSWDDVERDLEIDSAQMAQDSKPFAGFQPPAAGAKMIALNVETGAALAVEGTHFKIKVPHKDYVNILLSWH